ISWIPRYGEGVPVKSGWLGGGIERFICGRTVEAGNWHVVQAQVNRELCPVMEEVIEEVLTIGERPRRVADDVLTEGKLPRLSQLCVGKGSECGAGCCCVLIEGGEGCIAPMPGVIGELLVRIGHIHTGRGKDRLAEGRQRGDVHGKPAERHRLLVTLVFWVVGKSFQDAARSGHFVVVVLQQNVGGGHIQCSVSMKWRNAISMSPDTRETQINLWDAGFRCR